MRAKVNLITFRNGQRRFILFVIRTQFVALLLFISILVAMRFFLPTEYSAKDARIGRKTTNAKKMLSAVSLYDF